MDTVDTMRAFMAVAQEGSFTGGATRLGLSTKLVSKYVRHLEERLDAQLFNRTTRSVALTDVGAAYLEHCRSIVERIDEAETFVKERQTALSGPIRITAPTGFGSTHLAEALGDFGAKHPKVTVELVLSDARVALVEEGFDLGVRIGLVEDSSLVARRLADMPLVVCASPEYLKQNGTPHHPNDLADHPCMIDENHRDATSWRFSEPGGAEFRVRVAGRFRTNAPAAITRLAIQGVGIARCPRYAVEAAIEQDQLVQILGSFPSDDFGVYALYPLNRRLSARVRGLIDHLVDVFDRKWGQDAA